MQPKFNQIYRSLFNNISSFKSCSQPSRTSSSLQAAASCAPDVTHGLHLQTHDRQQKLYLKISETIYRLKIFFDHLTMDDYGWASSLGADFNEFWERNGGDYKIDYREIRCRGFNPFEKKYIKAVYRECILYSYLTGERFHDSFNRETTIDYIFYYFMRIGHPERGPRPDYDNYEVHPIWDMIIQHYPGWQRNSHARIQEFIIQKLNAPRFMYSTRATDAMKLFQLALRDPNSTPHVLPPEIMDRISNQLHRRYDFEHDCDVAEAAYLETLK
jgi:hypothetical protein